MKIAKLVSPVVLCILFLTNIMGMEEGSSAPEQDTKVVSVRPNAGQNDWVRKILQPGIVINICRFADEASRQNFAQTCCYFNECMREALVVHPNAAPAQFVPVLERTYLLFDRNADKAWCPENRRTLVQFLQTVPTSTEHRVKFQAFADYLTPKLKNPNICLLLLRKLRSVSQTMPSILFVQQRPPQDWRRPLTDLACTYTPSCALVLFTNPVLSLSMAELVALTSFAPNLTRFQIDTVIQCKTARPNLSSSGGFKALALCSESSIQVTKEYLKCVSPEDATLWDHFDVFRVLNETQLAFVSQHGLPLLVDFGLVKMKVYLQKGLLEDIPMWTRFCELSLSEAGQEKLKEIGKTSQYPFWKGLLENIKQLHSAEKHIGSGQKNARILFQMLSSLPSPKAIAFVVNYMDQTDIVNLAPIFENYTYRDVYRVELNHFLDSTMRMTDDEVTFIQENCPTLFHDCRVLNTKNLHGKFLSCFLSPEGQDKLKAVERTTQLPFWSKFAEGEGIDKRDVVRERQEIVSTLLELDLELIQLMNASPDLYYYVELPQRDRWGCVISRDCRSCVSQIKKLVTLRSVRLNGVGFFEGVNYSPLHCLEFMAALTAYDDDHFAVVMNPKLKFKNLVHRVKDVENQLTVIKSLGELKIPHLKAICEDPDTDFIGVGKNRQIELQSFNQQLREKLQKLDGNEWQNKSTTVKKNYVTQRATHIPVVLKSDNRRRVSSTPAAVNKGTRSNTPSDSEGNKVFTEKEQAVQEHRDVLFAYAPNEHLEKMIQDECQKLSLPEIMAVSSELQKRDEEIKTAENPFLKVLEVIRSYKNPDA